MPASRTAHIQRLLDKIQRLITMGTAASSRLTKWRLTLFVTGLLCAITLYRTGWYQSGNAALALFVIIFLIVAGYHNRLEWRIHRLRTWYGIKAGHLARVRLDWQAIPIRPHDTPTAHVYAKDLDLTGPHSLLHLIDNTISDLGQARLMSWLLEQPGESTRLSTRQRLIKDLAPCSRFRDKLTLLARLTGEQEINGRRLRPLLEHPIGIPHLNLILGLQSTLAATTLVLGFLAALDWLPGYWMFSFAAYVLVYLQTDQGEELLEHAVGLHHEMERLGTVLEHLERQAQRSRTALAETCRTLLETETSPSAYVTRAAKVLHAISIKAHPLVHLMVNALCPWDLWFTNRLQHIQREIARHLPGWLECLAEVEAASALANFAYLHPDYTWPELTKDAGLRASDLAHPLLPAPARVANSVRLSGLGTIQLITGSNMSGKSTFLRTVGINLCLAQAGAPVCASLFQWSWSRLACCIRVDDSLDAGLSFFYAEVKRLKHILDATGDRTAAPLLFLIDEIFKGTNNRERLIGSRAYIKALAGGHAFGLVSTHDLELTDLEKEIPSLSNAHFQETVSAGALHFDYRLRPGPCPTTNALRIMALEGLPVPPPS